MNKKEFIIKEYNEIRPIYDLMKDNLTYQEFKLSNYIDTNRWLSTLLISAETADNKTLYNNWRKMFQFLLLNCMREATKPNIKLIDGEYGFNTFKTREKEQLILQYFEGYITAQTVRMEPLWAIELAERLGILTLDK